MGLSAVQKNLPAGAVDKAIPPGAVGILLTCDAGKDRRAADELKNMLEEVRCVNSCRNKSTT